MRGPERRVRLAVSVVSLLVAVGVGVVLVQSRAAEVQPHAHHTGDVAAQPLLGSEPVPGDVVPFDGVARPDPAASPAGDRAEAAVGVDSRTMITEPDRPGAYGPAIPESRIERRLAPDGSPAEGYDPALLPQPDLAAVVTAPHGNERDVADASGVPRRPTGAEIVEDVVVDGCHLDYGEPGQCVPTAPPHAGHGGPMTWTCAALRPYFPDGVAVVGEDSLALDSDGDGVACGPGDR